MALKCVSVSREMVPGNGPGGDFYLGDALGMLDGLTEKYARKVKCVYLDPPFLTGQAFDMAVRVGAEEWRTMAGSVHARTFEDNATAEEYYSGMRRVIKASHAMLDEKGALFIHVDYRAHARIRILADEIFGEDNFVNEIIWAYKSGGRARASFPKKHDIILFYRKSKNLDFDIGAVLEKRAAPPSNHMRRHVDPDGRTYRTIRSGGRVYTYYDDDPVAPTDVWDDISHLQQKDYERTGYDTQKPLRLLHRIERCVGREGDMVVDLFAGSCTALEAARLNSMAFAGVDMCPLTVNIARRRLKGCPVTYHLTPSGVEGVICEASCESGVGVSRVTLDAFSLDEACLGINGFDAVDNWAVGYLEDDAFLSQASFERTQKTPELLTTLELNVIDARAAVRVGTIDGKSYYFLL